MPQLPEATLPEVANSDEGLAEALRAAIRDVPDFPHQGIVFKDVSTLFGDPATFRQAIDMLARPFRDQQIAKVVGVEARGFVVGAPVAYLLGAGFVPVRKAGKLPAATISQSYALEYGEAVLEIHTDAIAPGERTLILDDLLATGGTAAAAVSLVERLGGQVVAVAFLVELSALGGGRALPELPRVSLVSF